MSLSPTIIINNFPSFLISSQAGPYGGPQGGQYQATPYGEQPPYGPGQSPYGPPTQGQYNNRQMYPPYGPEDP